MFIVSALTSLYCSLLVFSSIVSNLPFLKHIAKKGKPIVISVGASYLSEVDEGIRTLKEAGCKDITILH